MSNLLHKNVSLKKTSQLKMCMVKISQLQNYLQINHGWTHARTDVQEELLFLMTDYSIKQTVLCLLFMGYRGAEFIAVNDNQLRRSSFL